MFFAVLEADCSDRSVPTTSAPSYKAWGWWWAHLPWAENEPSNLQWFFWWTCSGAL